MATLAFSVAGQFAGGLIGGPIGATIGRALGALAGSAVDNALFGGRERAEPVGRDIRLQGSTEGIAIPRVYGWNRVAGNIIWATELERISAQSSGSKGFGGSSSNDDAEDQIVASFAVALCEGEVTHLGRIWADGEVLETEGLTIRFYAGAEDQAADSLIVAKQGAASAPAYRGISYLVFERLPLGPFGNRIPNISAEVCRSAGDLEPVIRAINVIPGATEFGYDPVPRVRVIGPGSVVSENAHLTGRDSDWSLSIDQLHALCPNLEHVALIVAWFGDDLRCGECTIQPRTEGADRQIKDATWTVNGLGRGDVPVVSFHEGGPAYGGTPSDAAVLAAIADLKARGLKVTLSPFLLMDVPDGNGLLDPYTQVAGQPAYPWRGRITCDPAPGVVGTPNLSVGIDAQIDALVGTAAAGDFSVGGNTINYAGPSEWSYRRFVLHHAHLAQLAGGVDAFLIGSELRGLTTLRRSDDVFPFVDALGALATDVRSIVGGGTKITYAADWSEYSGYQPPSAPADKLFHLDPLWAHADIDAVAIDNYMPLADWRDGTSHLDTADATGPHDLDYLKGNIASGEGFDWYYASDADREDQTRTPITDGAYGEPWVWRYKDIYSWWANAHHNRVGGVRQASPTAWVAQSRPIWLMELGCPAVDKGANQPNVFPDAKSAENALPWVSNGKPDPLIQRQFLRAHLQWWRPDAEGFVDTQNPVSSVYAQRMLDPDRIYLWTWDARPHPAFPNLQSVWADAANHETGHWLTGRLGAAGVAELVTRIGEDYGVAITPRQFGDIQVAGMQIDRLQSLRDATDVLLSAAGLKFADRPEGLVLIAADGTSVRDLSQDDVAVVGPTLVTRRRGDATARLRRFNFSHFDRAHAYLSTTAAAQALDGDGQAAASANLSMDSAAARTAAERLLAVARTGDDAVDFALPPSALALETGDVVTLEGETAGPFSISEVRDGLARRLVVGAVPVDTEFASSSNSRGFETMPSPSTGTPLVYAAHLPAAEGAMGPSRLALGALALPWPGEVVITDSASGEEIAASRAAATLGVLTTDFAAGTSAIWDRTNLLEVQLFGGILAAADEVAVLSGVNRSLVECDDGGWEMIGFAEAELVGAETWRLSGLLRGLRGTGGGSIASAGSRFMLLNTRVAMIDVAADRLGGEVTGVAYAGRADATGEVFSTTLDIDPLLPLAPAHLRSERVAGSGDINMSWVRRNRRDGNSWALNDVPLDHMPEAYRVTIFDGPSVVRTIESGTPTAVYAAADQTTDFGSLPATFNFSIAQLSAAYGAGHAATGVFNG